MRTIFCGVIILLASLCVEVRASETDSLESLCASRYREIVSPKPTDAIWSTRSTQFLPADRAMELIADFQKNSSNPWEVSKIIEYRSYWQGFPVGFEGSVSRWGFDPTRKVETWKVIIVSINVRPECQRLDGKVLVVIFDYEYLDKKPEVIYPLGWNTPAG